jgi:hypothetical protein
VCPTEKQAVAWIQSILELVCRKGGNAGPGQPHDEKKSQLEPSRDGENVRRDREEPILDVMEEDQRPTE